MDAAELFRRSTDEWNRRIRAIPDDMWRAPTPCSDWDTRDLVNHVTYEHRWVPPLLAGATLEEVGDRFDGDLLGSDPKANAMQAALRAREAIPGVMSQEDMVYTSGGQMSA